MSSPVPSSTAVPVDVPAVPVSESSTAVSRLPLVITCTLGILGGAIGGLAVDRFHDFFKPIVPEGLAGNGIYTAEQLEQLAAERVRAEYRNVPLALGLLGLCVGGCLGAAQGIGAQSVGSASLRGAIAGGLTGLALGALGGTTALFLRELIREWNTLDSTGQPHPLKSQLHLMLVQLPTWIAIAAAVGLGALAARRGGNVARRISNGIVAVVLASLLFPTLASLLFSTEHPGGVIPLGFTNRLFWAILNGGLIGLFVGALTAEPPAESVPVAAPESASS